MLYDLVACPHRVTMDVFADHSKRDESSAFVQLLWEKGSLYENEVIGSLDVPFTDLSMYSGNEKEQRTIASIENGDPLIYGGRVKFDELLGDPDLLRKECDGYVAGDIKSGAGLEGSEELSKPKKHYAVQLGLYTDILERKGLSSGRRRAFIWDINGEEIIYDFSTPLGARKPRTLWQDYEDCLAQAKSIVDRSVETLPAYSGVCKLCHWYTVCLARLADDDDLTLIPELGRTKRDTLIKRIPTRKRLAEAEITDFCTGKKTVFPGIGPTTLAKFHERAKLTVIGDDAQPYLKQQIALPSEDRELYFDIEVDPMRDICYLHGFVERSNHNDNTERYVAFFAESPTAEFEKQAFSEAWQYVQNSLPCAIYYYSKYERTVYRKLQDKYPDVCSSEDLESLFEPTRAVDLYYDVVLKATEWPTRDYSIKSIAKYLGFVWRDTNPSGAASIEWFHRWVETGDVAVRQRILDYNEDDCRATRVLRDALDGLTVRQRNA